MISPVGDLRQFMVQIPDPRGCKGRRHPLSAILTAVICTVLCGADGYQPIAQWLHAQPVDFWHFLGFTRRPLRHGALWNRLMALDPRAFEDALQAWLEPLRGAFSPPTELRGVLIDGKSLRGTQTLDQLLTMLVEQPHKSRCRTTRFRLESPTDPANARHGDKLKHPDPTCLPRRLDYAGMLSTCTSSTMSNGHRTALATNEFPVRWISTDSPTTFITTPATASFSR